MTNLQKLSNRAKKALDVLADGGKFRHGLERNSYTGREQFQFRLQRQGGYVVKGVGMAAFYELEKAGLLVQHNHTSVATYYKLNAGAGQAADLAVAGPITAAGSSTVEAAQA